MSSTRSPLVLAVLLAACGSHGESGPAYVDLAAGRSRACVARRDGAVLCWGRRNEGDVTHVDFRPAAVDGLAHISRVFLSHEGGIDTDTLCAVDAHGIARCVGRGASCDVAMHPHPFDPGLGSVVSLSQSADWGCAVRNSGTTVCWGAGILARGDTDDFDCTESAPRSGLAAIAEVAVSAVDPARVDDESFGCARTTDGHVSCWGTTGRSLGRGQPDETPGTPAPVRGLDHVAQLALGDGFACARRVDGTVRCWGDPIGGAAGGIRLAPVAVDGLDHVVDLTAGVDHVCAARANGSVRCWGQNGSGQLGDGTTQARPAPTVVSGVSGVRRVAAGTGFTCALAADGVQCWGASRLGAFGVSTDDLHHIGDQSLTPVRVAF